MGVFMQYLLFSLFFLAFGCSSLPFPKSNVSNEQILSIKKGQTLEEIVKAFGNPIHWQNFEDGTYLNIYTNDWEDGAQIFCRNLAIAYDSENKVASHFFTKDGSDSQTRCNNYSAYSAQQSAAWSSFATSASQSIENSYSTSDSDSSGKSCYSDIGCGSSQVCAKKKNGYGGLEMEGICVNMRYYEDN